MPNISVKDVPEAWAEALRQRAARNHRSLQGELMALIERAANEVPPSGSERSRATAAAPERQSLQGNVVGLDRFGRPIVRHGWKTIEQIATEHLALFPEPIRGGPLGVDIIREERDAR